ncbi:MAG: pentapeptide repeat-containing protein [Bacteroidales bacterium]|nr:pentapeptide repeat-containing protein [Bacteroidales bacterium]
MIYFFTKIILFFNLQKCNLQKCNLQNSNLENVILK